MCDLGGVYFTNGTSIVINKFSRKYKIPREKLIHALKSPGLVYDYGTGKINREEFWKRVMEYLKISKKVALEIEAAWMNSYKPKKMMQSLIRQLRERYKVVVVSGNLKERIEFLNMKYNLDTKFDRYFYSFDYSTNKPSEDLCKYALKKLRAKPEECVMIDDNLIFLKNVKKLGINIIHFRNPFQLKEDLINLGIVL